VVSVENLPRAAVNFEDLPKAGTLPAPVPPPPVVDIADIPRTPESAQAMLPQAPPGLVTFGRAVAGGVRPEHEAKIKGPIVSGIEAANIARQGEIAKGIEAQTNVLHAEEAARAQVDVDRAKVYEAEVARRKAEHDADAARARQQYTDAIEGTARLGVLDPGRLYNSKTSGEKVLQNVAVLLGGVFGGLAGQENKALAVVERAQNQDIEAQKFAYHAGLDLSSGRKSAFGQLMDQFGDERAAEGALRAAQLDRQMAEARVMKAKAQTVEEKNAYDRFIAGLADRQADEIKRGYQFVPRQAGGARYPVTDARGQTIYVDEATRNKMFMEGLGTEAKYTVTDAEQAARLAAARVEHGGLGGKAEKELNDQVWKAAKELASLQVPEVERAVDDARKLLVAAPLTYAQRAANAAGVNQGSPQVYQWGFGPEAGKREQAWAGVKNTLYHALSGAAVSANEEKRLRQQLDGAGDNISRMEAVKEIESVIQAKKTNILAGVSPEARAAYEARGGAKQQAAAPTTAKKGGW
jgi:hypothetical protein